MCNLALKGARRIVTSSGRQTDGKAHIPKRKLRKFLSLKRAQLLTLLGMRRGYFLQEPYPVPPDLPVGTYPDLVPVFEESAWRSFLADMASHVDAFRHFDGPLAPRWYGSRMFPPLDGAAAFAAVKRFRPSRVLEIGSGDSTYFLNAAGAEIVSIDPQPRGAVSKVAAVHHARMLLESDAELAAGLRAGDILFIDSSHFLIPGSDVDILLNRFLPRLTPGVIVHIHDIFLPGDYPPELRRRNYNEQNALAPLLISGNWEILWPAHYVVFHHRDEVLAAFDGFLSDKDLGAASLWIRKRR